MSPREPRTFEARMGVLPETAAFVESFCAANAIARDNVLRLTFIVEELFTNSVCHGYCQETDAPIRLTLWTEEGEVGLLYEDAAPAYDPLAQLDTPPPSLAGPIESRAIGGLGVYLVSRFVKSARYAYEDGFNRLWLVVRCNGEGVTG